MLINFSRLCFAVENQYCASSIPVLTDSFWLNMHLKSVSVPGLQINEISFRMQLEFSSYAFLALVNFLQGIITSATPVIALEENGGIDASKARVEALTALGCVSWTELLMLAVTLILIIYLGLWIVRL